MILEPERYELQESPLYDFPPSRREFFQRLGGGLLVIALIGQLDAQESGRGQRRGGM